MSRKYPKNFNKLISLANTIVEIFDMLIVSTEDVKLLKKGIENNSQEDSTSNYMEWWILITSIQFKSSKTINLLPKENHW